MAFLALLIGGIFHGGAAVPIFWIIGAVLIVAGVIAMFRGSLLAGIVLAILGIILGGLNVF